MNGVLTSNMYCFNVILEDLSLPVLTGKIGNQRNIGNSGGGNGGDNGGSSSSLVSVSKLFHLLQM